MLRPFVGVTMVEATNSQHGTFSKSWPFSGTKLLAGVLVLLIESQALAVRWVLPPETAVDVEVVNGSRDNIDLYRKNFGQTVASPDEESLMVPAGQTVNLKLKVPNALNLLEVISGSLKLRYTNPQTLSSIDLPSGQSNHLVFQARAPRNSGELVVTNLSSQCQDGRILSRKSGSTETELLRFQLKAREVLSLGGVGLSGTAFSIQSNLNISAILKNNADIAVAELKPNHLPLPAPRGRYFVLGNDSRTAGYLVDLTDPAMIAAARAQIKNPEILQSRILIAEVGAISNLANRNWYDKLQHPWSWQITQPLRFASLASQFCDGHPQQVEDQLENWLNGGHTGGRPIICFWGYQVLEELP
jgi:hypothetical protein